VLLHDSSVKRVPDKAYNRGKESKQGAWKAEADDVAETLTWELNLLSSITFTIHLPL
jgi:hypothetical protein